MGWRLVDEMSFIQWIVGQTGTAGIAVLAIWIMKVMNEQSIVRRTEDMKREQERHDEAVRRERENADIHREDKRAMMEIVRAHTESNARLTDAVLRLDRTARGADAGTVRPAQ